MPTKAGYEGLLYYGTANATANTLLTNVEDLNYDNSDTEKAETTTRGAGTLVPIKTEKIVALGAQITWSMLNKTTDAAMLALVAAARAGLVVAIRTRAHSTGLGYDGDCNLTVTHEMTLKGISKYNFTATPNDENRTPLLNN